MLNKIDTKWFVAQVKANSYKMAIENLQRQGVQIFLPEVEITVRKNNKFRVEKKIIFPGYLFISFNPRDFIWTKVNNTFGVSKILSFNGRPAEIPSELISELKRTYAYKQFNFRNGELKQGDKIQIKKGPFAEIIAKVERVDEKSRIWILFEYMGGKRKMKLDNLAEANYNKLKD